MADTGQKNEKQNEEFDENVENVEEETVQAEDTKDGGDTEMPEESGGAFEGSDADGADGQVEEETEKKSLFGKKKEKKDKRQEQIEELTDKLKRSMAEFDNFRKRTDKEKTQMYEIGAREVIDKILPVVDNFERAFENVTEEEKNDPFIGGMDMVFKQLLKALEDMGVTAIEAVGSEFDPNLHNAVMQVENEEYESGIVAQELQKGYKYKENVVRHSMVAVVQ